MYALSALLIVKPSVPPIILIKVQYVKTKVLPLEHCLRFRSYKSDHKWRGHCVAANVFSLFSQSSVIEYVLF